MVSAGSEDEGPSLPPQPPPLPPGVTEEDVEIFKKAQEFANEACPTNFESIIHHLPNYELNGNPIFST